MRGLALCLSILPIFTITTGSAEETNGKPNKVSYVEQLDEEFAKVAPRLIRQLKDQQVSNVGVVKFLTRRDDGKPSHNMGELNLGLARRLKVALIMANEDERFGIIGNVPEQARKYQLTTHLDGHGRKEFFVPTYELAWNPNKKVKADRFLTGLATISEDLNELTVRIDCFDSHGKLQEGLAQFTVSTTPRILADTGHNYLLTPKKHPEFFARGGIKKEDRDKAVVDATLKPEPKPNQNLVVNPDPPQEETPLYLEVRYDGKPVHIEDSRIPEPPEGTTVEFYAKNVSEHTLGVVLKVNGENTLFRETSPHEVCHKWVIAPGEEVKVRGFQTTYNDYDPFEVLSFKESLAHEINYGSLAGLIQVIVFAGTTLEETPKSDPVKLTPEEASLASIARGGEILSDIKSYPGTLNGLKDQLMDSDKARDVENGRGLIGSGDVPKPKPVQDVYFEPYSLTPTYVLTLRYYKPKQ